MINREGAFERINTVLISSVSLLKPKKIALVIIIIY